MRILLVVAIVAVLFSVGCSTGCPIVAAVYEGTWEVDVSTESPYVTWGPSFTLTMEYLGDCEIEVDFTIAVSYDGGASFTDEQVTTTFLGSHTGKIHFLHLMLCDEGRFKYEWLGWINEDQAKGTLTHTYIFPNGCPSVEKTWVDEFDMKRQVVLNI